MTKGLFPRSRHRQTSLTPDPKVWNSLDSKAAPSCFHSLSFSSLHYGGLLRSATPLFFRPPSSQLFSLDFDRYMIEIPKNVEKKSAPIRPCALGNFKLLQLSSNLQSFGQGYNQGLYTHVWYIIFHNFLSPSQWWRSFSWLPPPHLHPTRHPPNTNNFYYPHVWYIIFHDFLSPSQW